MLLLVYVLVSILMIEFALHRAKPLREAERVLQGSDRYMAYRRRDTHLWTRWRLYLFGIPLMLPRFLLILVCVFCHGLISAAALCGAEVGDNVLISPMRRKIVKLSSFFWTRLLLIAAGFWRVTEKGARDPRACVIVCNHSSWVDIMYFLSAQELPSFLANAGVKRMPLIGTIAIAMHSVFFNRTSKDDRASTLSIVEERQRRIYAQEGFPQLLLFPEGTTTNGSGLLYFRKGAFITGVPVQPVAIRYPFRHFSPTMDSIPMLPQVILLCCQLYNSMEVTRMETVELPNKTAEERAQTVREKIAQQLGVPLLSDRFEDKFEFIEFAFRTKAKHS